MKFDWKSLSTFEPAVLRGAWIAIVGVLTAFGLEVSGATQAKATAIIAAAAVIVPLVQAFWTRQAVTPNERVDQLVDDALATDPPALPSASEDPGAITPEPYPDPPDGVQDDDSEVEPLPDDALVVTPVAGQTTTTGSGVTVSAPPSDPPIAQAVSEVEKDTP
jgi:hypothetical protein